MLIISLYDLNCMHSTVMFFALLYMRCQHKDCEFVIIAIIGLVAYLHSLMGTRL